MPLVYGRADFEEVTFFPEAELEELPWEVPDFLLVAVGPCCAASVLRALVVTPVSGVSVAGPGNTDIQVEVLWCRR